MASWTHDGRTGADALRDAVPLAEVMPEPWQGHLRPYHLDNDVGTGRAWTR